MDKQLSAWRLIDVDPGSGVIEDLSLGRGDGWIAVTAPGDTYLALVEANRLEHPFVGRNERGAAWVRDREWWWHTRFTVDGEGSAELVFDGLDTFADIHVGGAMAATSDNMFRQVRLDVSHLAGEGEQDLAIRFHPVGAKVDPAAAPNWNNFKIFTSEGRTLVRKAQYGWGWDWGPNLPTVGVWRPARLEQRAVGVTVVDIDFATLELTEDSAVVRVAVETTGPAPLEVELLDPDGLSVARAAASGSEALTFTVQHPRLWWTAALGDQPLYTLVVRVAGGVEHRRRVGIRTIALDQSADPDEPGTTFFRFVLNGVSIFAKGACWIPASAFLGAVPPDTYATYVARAAAANMNMLRIWGGGVYEDDAFYDACDAVGVLVWQDFMFACAPYPEDGPFIANVVAEVREQVRRLRSRPCLALWCGNNEIEAMQDFDNRMSGMSNGLVGRSIFETHIPAVLQELDPQTPYWSSSPRGGPSPNSMRAGDVHDWTVWHGMAPFPDADPAGPMVQTGPEAIAYTRYAEDVSRFVSEFGIHGAPDLPYLRQWLAPEDLSLGSGGFKARTKDPADRSGDMASLVTGRPRTIEEFVEFTQRVQVEGLTFGIEHFRRRKPHCSGTLLWQFNDAWPGISWSLIDHGGGLKPGYHAIRRVYAPVIASFRRDDDGSVELWVSNDTLSPVRGQAILALSRLDGEGDDWRIETPVDVGPNESARVWRQAVAANPDRVLTVTSASGAFASNRLLFAPVKDLTLPSDPGLEWSVQGDRLTVAARGLALAVRLDADDVEFSDDAFDLSPGETGTIVASRTLSAGEVRVSSWSERRARRDAQPEAAA